MFSARPCGIRSWIGVLVLASPSIGQHSLQKNIARALDRARPVMLEMAEHTNGGQHALLCLAMAHDGLTRQHKGFRAALDRLARSKLARTYDLSLRLMVLAKVKDFPKRTSMARRDLHALLENRRGGAFSYASKGGRWDLSNTQYAALGMRAAASLRIHIRKRDWESLARSVLASQVYRGGFGYHPKSSPTPSMTVAGIAVLEVCLQQLNSSRVLAKKIELAITRGWSHMAQNKTTIGAGPAQQRNYYYHYGLERAAILSDRVLVGNVDWYATGAKMFLAQESKAGGWGYARPARKGGPLARRVRNLHASITTAFAVLFLRRSFQRTLTGPITPVRNVLLKNLDAQASEQMIRTTAKLEITRGYRAVPGLIRAMRSPILTKRKVVALALPAITNRFRSYSPYAKAADVAAIIKSAELFWLREGPKLLANQR